MIKSLFPPPPEYNNVSGRRKIFPQPTIILSAMIHLAHNDAIDSPQRCNGFASDIRTAFVKLLVDVFIHRR